MADTKISDNPAADALSGTELLPVVQGGANKRSLPSAVATYFRTLVNAFSKNQSVAFVVLTDGATISTDASLSNNFYLLIGGNRTLANPTNLTNGMVLNYIIKQDGTGSRTLAYGNKFKFFGGAPTLSTAAGAIDGISGVYHASLDIIVCAFVANAS